MHYRNSHPKKSHGFLGTPYKGGTRVSGKIKTAFLVVTVIAVLAFAAALSDGSGLDSESNTPPPPDAAVATLPSPAQASAPASITLDRALIVFTFDDGNESDYLIAFPVLQKYGIEGTSFINPYNPDHNVKTKLSWPEIKQMYTAGWDFEDHTYTHFALAEATAGEIKLSAELVNNAFSRNGLRTPDTLAYPYGNYNQTVIDVIKQYRKQARLALYADDFADLNNLKQYEIPSVSADMQTEMSLLELKQTVDKACAQHAVVVFMFHCLYNNEKNDMGSQPVQTSSVLFTRLVDYCVDKGCGFTTMDGFLKLYTGG